MTEEDVHYFEPKHGTIFGEDGVEERLAESLMKSWESSDQQKDVLIRESIGDDLKMKEEKEMCKDISIA